MNRELDRHLNALLDDLEDRHEFGCDQIPKVPSGLEAFDLDGGFGAGVWLIVGAPLSGRSALAHLTALTSALGERVPTTYVTVRGSGLATTRRWLASLTRLPLSRLLGGELGLSEWELVNHAVVALAGAPLELIEGAGMSLAELGAAVLALPTLIGGRQLLVIDSVDELPGAVDTLDLGRLPVSPQATVIALAESAGSPSRTHGAAGMVHLTHNDAGSYVDVVLDRRRPPGHGWRYPVTVRPGTCDLHSRIENPASWGTPLPLWE